MGCYIYIECNQYSSFVLFVVVFVVHVAHHHHIYTGWRRKKTSVSFVQKQLNVPTNTKIPNSFLQTPQRTQPVFFVMRSAHTLLGPDLVYLLPKCISCSGEPRGISKGVQTGIDSYFVPLLYRQTDILMEVSFWIWYTIYTQSPQNVGISGFRIPRKVLESE